MYKFCLFDLDGTLVDTVLDIGRSANYALTSLGFPECDIDSYYRKIGNGMRKLCERALPDGTDENTLEEMLAVYNEHYSSHCCDNSILYPGIKDLVHNLKSAGVCLGIITNKPHSQALIILDALFDPGDFMFMEGQSDRFRAKPDPESLLTMMKRYGFTETETIYVGDSNIDIQFAKAAGVTSVGVAWGFRGVPELQASGADHIAYTAEDILKFVTE